MSFAITVSRTDPQHTTIQVQPRVHFILYDGILPGPENNPWTDLFVMIRGNLGQSS